MLPQSVVLLCQVVYYCMFDDFKVQTHNCFTVLPLSKISARALELFLESLLTKACQVTQSRNAKTMTTAHL